MKPMYKRREWNQDERKIMKAKKKEMDIQPVDSLGIDVAPRLELISVEPPATRQAGIKVESVEELVSKLKNEAKVIS